MVKIKINYLNYKKIGGSSGSSTSTTSTSITDFNSLYRQYINDQKKNLPSNKSNEEEISKALTKIEQTLEEEGTNVGEIKEEEEKEKDNKFIEELKTSIDSIIEIIKNKEKNIENRNEEIATKKLINVFNYLENKKYYELKDTYVPAIEKILSSLHDMYITETKEESLSETKKNQLFANFIIKVINLSDTGIDSFSENSSILGFIKGILNNLVILTYPLDDNYTKLNNVISDPDPQSGDYW